MVNKVILIGNVGADPEVRYLEGGVAVTRFSLATTETYNNKNGERVSQTEWHNIVLWRNLAQIAEKYVKKGMTLYIEGRLRTRTWDDQNGNKRYTTEIYGDTMQMLSRKQDNYEKTPEPPMPESPSSLSNSDDSDDLPF
ncbi:single-stranded DNA-binding protein [Sanguibacteroides justesenii]|uniref:Single-stranded DNA-binding protein n=2 Tax=Porphyromonadaceae TaxID=171551 RepID=A0A0C3RCU9_9PORP|nr:single-stranded DNA-binding protein [Sanguibacteroides justesenii]KIO46522.1 single-stranded DNA-binding protein [Sanguibacteroides justesenii]PXZ44010.1 single-stranded DNA-binding protein [Sanguibacteroides justesenii]